MSFDVDSSSGSKVVPCGFSVEMESVVNGLVEVIFDVVFPPGSRVVLFGFSVDVELVDGNLVELSLEVVDEE